MYEDKTPEAIKAEILAAIRQSQGLSAMAGGFADGVAGPVAEQLSEAYRALEGVTSMLFVDESSGGYIDLVGGQYYNITRREGTRAYCDISFSGTPGLVIPKGTAFLTAGGLSYALMAAVALGPEGTGRGRLEAAEAGSAYNVEAGAIDRMYVNLTGLTDYHSEAAAGGTDAESDAALLARVRERVQRPPTSGNGYQYRQWAMEVAGVGRRQGGGAARRTGDGGRHAGGQQRPGALGGDCGGRDSPHRGGAAHRRGGDGDGGRGSGR